MAITIGSIVCMHLFWLGIGPLFMRAAGLLPLAEPYGSYLTVISPGFAMALGVLIFCRLMLKKWPWRLVRSDGSFRPLFCLLPALAYVLTIALFQALLSGALSGMVVPQRPHPCAYLSMALLVLPCTVIQCCAEEFMLRVVPSRIASTILLRSAISALCFLLPHLGNREVRMGGASLVILYYLLFGFVGTYVSIRSGGFEYSIGIHIANNLFISLICNYEGSSLPTSPLFVSHAPVGTWLDLLSLSLALTVSALTVRRLLSGKRAGEA